MGVPSGPEDSGSIIIGAYILCMVDGFVRPLVSYSRVLSIYMQAALLRGAFMDKLFGNRNFVCRLWSEV